MIAAIAGGVFGLGLVILCLALVPPPTDLVGAVGRWESARNASATSHDNLPPREALLASLGGKLTVLLRRRGITFDGLRKDLALVDRTVEQHVTRKLTGAFAGAVLGVALTGFVAAIGRPIGLFGTLALVVICAAVMFVASDGALKAEATKRRREMRAALGCFLDLVALSLAGGRGVPQALSNAVGIGDGWAFTQLDDAIYRARVTGISTWQAFAELGERTDVRQLRELGSSLALVAENGAQVKESLIARAASQRSRALSELEADEKQATDHVSYLLLAVVFGLILFIFYPLAATIYSSVA